MTVPSCAIIFGPNLSVLVVSDRHLNVYPEAHTKCWLAASGVPTDD